MGRAMSNRMRRSAARPAAAVAAVLAGLVALLSVLLSAPPEIAYAESVSASQWQLTSLHARTAWRMSTGAGIIVAVLDSGVDASHPDLVGQVLPGADFVDGTTDGRKDFVGHGTTVAGLIAGRDRLGGVTGLAPGAKILPVRVLDRQNRYTDASTVARGLHWAVDHGARVVNLSLGGSGRSAELADAIQYAYQHDVVVVACTGNTAESDGSHQIWYPAREPGVLAVSGLAQTRSGGASHLALWSGALTGPATVLTAPAVDLLGAKPGGYWRVQGTSFAAPLVTAAAALVRAHWPGMNAANVINRLVGTAYDLGARGRDNTYGFGEVNPLGSLTATVPAVAVNPLVPASPAATPLAALGTGAPSGAGGPVPTAASSPGAVPVAASVPAIPRGVAWALAAGILVLIGGLGSGAMLIRRRPWVAQPDLGFGEAGDSGFDDGGHPGFDAAERSQRIGEPS
jgi:type VII secretion-associated serine protease mycosin